MLSQEIKKREEKIENKATKKIVLEVIAMLDECRATNATIYQIFCRKWQEPVVEGIHLQK